MALGACLLIAALGPRPRATRFDLLLSRAALASGAGQPSAALAWLDEAIAFDPALAALHLPAARLALQAGDMSAMRRHLLAAPAETRSSTEFGCLMALLPSGDSLGAPPPSAGCSKAASTPRLASAEIPSQAELPAAAAALRLQLETGPNDLPGWERLAALTELTDPPAVESVILQAYRHFPEGSAILDGIWQVSHQDNPGLNLAERSARAGQLLAAAGDWALAGAAWTRAVDLEPAFPQAQAFLGVAMGQIGADGLPLVLLASAEAPDDPVIRLLLGQYLLTVGDSAGAARQLDYASHLDPENPAIGATLGAALAQEGRLDEAAGAYLQAASREPQDPAFWLLLAEFSLRYDYQVDSLGLDAARNAVALSPQDPAALSALGMADSLVGDGPTGERLLRSAISLDPSNPLGWYRYGLVVLDLGRADEAREALATAVTLDPDGIVGGLAEASLTNLAGGLR
jgi:tetratricopeptide (TPR) repeat protein